MKIRFLTMTLLGVFAFALVSQAQNPERNKRNPEQRKEMIQRGERMANRMDKFFTEEQQEQVKAIRLQTAKDVKPLRNELRELEARQQTLTTADKADLKAIYANIDKMSDVKAKIQKTMAKQQQEIRSLLSEEQLLKFDAMKGRMGERNRDGNRPNRGPRPSAG